MKTKNYLLIALMAAQTTAVKAQDAVTHFDMSLSNGAIVEQVSNKAYTVSSQLPACTVEGLDGEALRFDGYSNYVKAGVPSTLSTEALTVSVTLAAETYPMMQTDAAETTPTYATICGNMSDDGKKGFALQLSSQGDLKAIVGLNYGGGYKREIAGSQKLQRGQWNQLTLVYDKAGNAATLYLNGTSIGSTKVNNCAMLPGEDTFYIGKDATETKAGPFLLNTFCGAIDDIAIYNEAFSSEKVTVISEKYAAAPRPNFNYPAERYAESLWRPLFHGMPSGGWTNETHGMTYSDGRYHVFFQKNANGPYMSRLHWGHLSSENLYQWTEEPIAIYPGESYDIKGCWSGCVYDDNGTPTILYTAVDNAKARIVQAKPTDATLADWGSKSVIIDGTPAGGFQDFRDPYYFEANGNKYVIVGTGKNNIGACTLHKYSNGSWSNDGTIFFQGTNASQHGTFREMPNVTPMGDGKYLFTCTPLGMSAGVRTLCWVGTIGTDGKFTPDGGISNIQYLELGGISRDGYGLLSPTILSSDLSPLSSHLLIGIVPDKLADTENYKMGWAHNYSLPRELSLDASGKMVQKPYSGLTAMRTTTTATVEENLTGSKQLVSGRHIELLGEFTPTSGTCGFRLLRDASLTYDATTRSLKLDLTGLQRISNDGGSYQGVYTTTVPEALTKLHVYLDGSILDIFVNDKWAYSVRLFPTDATALEAEVFATSETAVKVSAWTLDASQSEDTGIHSPLTSHHSPLTSPFVYDLQGRKIVNGKSVNGKLQKGLYIQNGRKFLYQ